MGEVVHPSVQGHNRDSTFACFHFTADPGGEGPGEHASNCPVNAESERVLTLELSLVLPWDAFWVCSVLSESVSDPRVALEILLQEVKVLTLHLLSGDGGWSDFESFIGFS